MDIPIDIAYEVYERIVENWLCGQMKGKLQGKITSIHNINTVTTFGYLDESINKEIGQPNLECEHGAPTSTNLWGQFQAITIRSGVRLLKITIKKKRNR